MFNRRDLLKAGVGLAASVGSLWLPGQAISLTCADSADRAAGELDRWIATSHHARILGRPRSLAAVQQGFWPVPPSRVLILRPHPLAGPHNRWESRKSSSHCPLRYELRQRGGTRNWQGEPDWNCWKKLSDHKLGLITRITSALASYYGVPELRHDWAYEMAAREGLGSTYIGGNVAQPQQFQHDNVGSKTIKTDNTLIDHWLILIPEGTRDWDGWYDDVPVHVMTTHIFADPTSSRGWTSFACVINGRAVLSLAEPSRRHAFDSSSSPRIIELSRMDRLSAARLLNEHVIAVAREGDEWLKQRS